MYKFLGYIFLFFTYSLVCHQNNLVIIIDNLQQETVKTEEINMTHQLITALQQKSAAVLISGTLWKNIIDRKKRFEKQLKKAGSLPFILFSMYKETNQTLQDLDYNLIAVNRKLSSSWFSQRYPQLAQLSEDKLNQLKFDFLCYTFVFCFAQWHVYNPGTGMLLFVPIEFDYGLDTTFEIFNQKDCLKYVDKKSNIVQSLQKLFTGLHKYWVIYLTGHGHPKNMQQDANIAGLHIDDFKELLQYCNDYMRIKLFVYASCYGGGVHTIEPYKNMILDYPVIVTSLTDAPIFAFGLFEGMKLPPYDQEFRLQPENVARNKGLLPYALQNYQAFFKRAWKGQFDLHLIQYISKFFACDMFECHVQKVENFPLIRKAGACMFTPIQDSLFLKMVQQVIAEDINITATKPIFLYTKKIKKIKMDQVVPIVSMIPGMVSHEIKELYAPKVLLSSLLLEMFLSIEDMQPYKNFLIKQLFCYDDLSFKDHKTKTFSDALIVGQPEFIPNFLHKACDAYLYYHVENDYYLVLYKKQKMIELIQLNNDQILIMQEIKNFVEQAINFKAQDSGIDYSTFHEYMKNKNHQQVLVGDCIKAKICKK